MQFKIYHCRYIKPIKGEWRPKWKLMTCVPDQPLHSELHRSGMHGYAVPIPANSLVNVRFNPKTKNLTLNWPYSYGMVTKNSRISKLSDFEYKEQIKLSEEQKLSPAALHYGLRDKGGISFFAVVEDIPTMLPKEPYGKAEAHQKRLAGLKKRTMPLNPIA